MAHQSIENMQKIRMPNAGYAYGTTSYGGGYLIGGHARVGYGAPFTSPRVPWNDQGLMRARRNPVPYGNTSIPSYANGGFGGYHCAASGVCHGAVSGDNKGNQTGSNVHTTSTCEMITSGVKSLKLDAQ